MGIMTPYGDPETCFIIDRVCGAPCKVPGLNLGNDKMSGCMDALKLKPANLGPYVTGGYELAEVFKQELNACVTGMACMSSYDPYGCYIEPGLGYELRLTHPKILTKDGGEDGRIDHTCPMLQVYFNGAELPAGAEIPEEVCIWVYAWLR